ncbi:selenide, water dikinase SelD [Ktedonosporobacter rubrisoli]|uniref:Selenide, water dikinase n=1 Tax=Ktedonosporobacter rubrisoli TaxID=2509675 RepID=A0A4P6JZ00_KTERU|nr:selenide, water dikinase SelD [Ktedonosporobacter rubrisoli]QBD80944.1 selenide, water dikinase SelD [Ktedonosporobacter rubrisoli]
MTTNQRVRLTELASCAGCAAKIGSDILAQVLRPLRQRNVPAQLLVGLGAIDDAAVYQVNEQQAIISTADFFPPVVDDPYTFGAIAAANALSDIYAMGGQVLMAINLVAWPEDLDTAILSEVLRGGMDIVEQAGSAIAGGHSISDSEPKYGLAVTGMVHPERILTKGGAKPGDVLVLSKPLGTGLLTTAQKQEKVQEADMAAAVASMTRLNRRASELLVQAGSAVHAATDITGFSLLGHAWEMALQSQAHMRFDYAALPLLPNVRHYAEAGCIPGGTHRNERAVKPHVRFAANLDQFDQAICFDPQTSGGLFAAIEPALWATLSAQQEVPFWRIGEVTALAGEGEEPVLRVE